MAGYLSNLRKDIARWQAAGLIDADTAAALLRDAENRPGGISFGSILAMLAAALLGAALLLLVAANWEALPRLFRVGMIFAGIIVGYVGGAWLKQRDHAAFGEALWFLAATAFGAGIALIGQMYHLSGDEAQAVLLWCGGTGLAALALRSGPLTVGAVLIAGGWLLLQVDWRGHDLPLGYLAVAAALWGVSLWTHSATARHLLLLSLTFYALLVYMDGGTLAAPVTLVAVSAAAFAVSVQYPEQSERVLRLGGGLPVQALLGFLAGMAVIQFEHYEKQSFTLLAMLTFAGVVGALLLEGRHSRMLRWLAYAGFIFELGFVYIVLLGSMLGTAGFFFAAGVVLAGIAYAITRIERRMANVRRGGEGAA